MSGGNNKTNNILLLIEWFYYVSQLHIGRRVTYSLANIHRSKQFGTKHFNLKTNAYPIVVPTMPIVCMILYK